MSLRFQMLLLTVLALSTGSLWACESRSASKAPQDSGCSATCGVGGSEQAGVVTDRIAIPAAGPLSAADEIAEDLSAELRHIAIEETSGFLQDASN